MVSNIGHGVLAGYKLVHTNTEICYISTEAYEGVNNSYHSAMFLTVYIDLSHFMAYWLNRPDGYKAMNGTTMECKCMYTIVHRYVYISNILLCLLPLYEQFVLKPRDLSVCNLHRCFDCWVPVM